MGIKKAIFYYNIFINIILAFFEKKSEYFNTHTKICLATG